MIRAASWTCLVAVACARLYERCELARDLHAMGVERDHVSTWVCIAYHESRFDTTSRNHYSGDHGIFQISELYWCGPGKACGLPCGDLRDEDISDDVQCALRVHKEHTRLQGDGFLAWVVYPQHCKHNTKKYIVGCDTLSKNTTTRTISQSRSFSSVNSTGFTFNSNIDNLQPPYLIVNSLLRGNFGKVLQAADRKSAPANWLDYKIENIDDLTLPVFDNNKKREKISTPQRMTITTVRMQTTTAATPTVPWKRNYIESKQFRKRIFPNSKESAIVSNRNEIVKSSPSYINEVTPMIKSTSAAAVLTSTTSSPTTSTVPRLLQAYSTTTRKPTTNWLTRTVATTSRPKIIITSTRSTFKPSTTTSSTIKGPALAFSFKPNVMTTSRPNTKSPQLSYTKLSNAIKTTSIPRIANTTKTSVPSTTVHKPFTWTTSRPILISTIAYSPIGPSARDGRNIKQTTKAHPTEANPSTVAGTTSSRITLTQNPSSRQKTTLSIFDFYLNPTRAAKVREYKFPEFNSTYKLKIFSDGTTTFAPHLARGEAVPATRSYVRPVNSQTSPLT